ncbi:MAG TPA: hypothetical protein DCR95_12130 [Desulfobacter sp.]|uniref:hypothetical protein n=1 Tax=Desulfobacter sp. UBA2225 TaxID=1961413 RepID=UPI000E8F9BE5|nr:hypothetical protein [Desulfobacter sp. UBA2225]HAR34796.1 hypothetical protein [Desulfobacter sp.]
MSKRISITLGAEESERFQKFIDYSPSGTTPTGVVRSLINAAINRVNHARATGLVPKKIKNINPDVIEKMGEFSNEYSDFNLFCALHYRELEVITEEQFQNHRDNLPFYIFARSLENIELDKNLDGTLSDKERRLMELEAQAEQLRAELKAEAEREKESRNED